MVGGGWLGPEWVFVVEVEGRQDEEDEVLLGQLEDQVGPPPEE